MQHIKIAIGADHRGFAYKETLQKNDQVGGETIEWIDSGAYDDERSDYPVFAHKVAKAVAAGTVDAGVLLCGTGIGMAIAANRHKHVYAGLVWSAEVAQKAREDDGCNVLVIPADYVTEYEAKRILAAWLGATFKEGRYAQRLHMIDECV